MKNIILLLLISFTTCYSGSFWQKVDYIAGNDTIFTIKIDKNNIIYIGTQNFGLLRSIDNGITFSKCTLKNRPSQKRLAIDSLNNLYFSQFDSLYFSSDNGDSWEVINNGLSGPINSFEVTKNNYVVINIFNGQTYLSTDFGKIWSDISTGTLLDSLGVYNFAVDCNNNIYACSNKLFRTSDFGKNWVELFNKYTPRIAFNFFNDIFVRISQVGEFSGISRSTDYGQIFRKIYIIHDTTANNKFIINQQNHIYVNYDKYGLFFSMDNGDYWEQLDTFDFDKSIPYCLNFDKLGYLWVGTFGKGLYRSKYPMKKFYIDVNFNPRLNVPKLLGQNDTLEYDIKTSIKGTEQTIPLTEGVIINEINSEKLSFKTDSLGVFKYKFVVPMNRDTGEYSIKFYFEKFGFELADTLYDKILIKKYVRVPDNNILNKELSLQITPIPATDIVYITARLPEKLLALHETKELQIKLISFDGKELFSVPASSGVTKSISLEKFAQGIYFIRAEASDLLLKESVFPAIKQIVIER